MLIALALTACGKNDGIYQGGYGYMGQAPAPYGYAPAPQYGNGFNPQMPAGYPSQYTPFVPIHNYMQGSPSTQQYWGQHWNGWQNYAQYNGYNQYDFNRFWYDYCPQQWQGTQWNNVYNYYNTNYYSWMTPQTQFAPQMNPNYFWQNYTGYDNYCYSCY